MIHQLIKATILADIFNDILANARLSLKMLRCTAGASN
jgi:hypothetical protein